MRYKEIAHHKKKRDMKELEELKAERDPLLRKKRIDPVKKTAK